MIVINIDVQQGFVPGMLGVTHGALQFMTYEEMKTYYNQYRKSPIDAKLVNNDTISVQSQMKKKTSVRI